MHHLIIKNYFLIIAITTAILISLQHGLLRGKNMRKLIPFLLFGFLSSLFSVLTINAMRTADQEVKKLLKQAEKETDSLFKAVNQLLYNKKVTLPTQLKDILQKLDARIRLMRNKQELQNVKADIEQFIGKTVNSIKAQVTIVLPWQHMTYADLEQKMAANFRPANIEPRKAYEYLGLTPEAGKKMPWVDLRKKLTQLKSTMNEQAYRQLEYAFHYNSSKAEYDAFLDGEKGLEALKKSIKLYAELQEALMAVQEYLLQVAEIDNTIMIQLKK
jgi:hypothetical protein